MAKTEKIERWEERFSFLKAVSAADLKIARDAVHFPVLEADAVAYELDGECPNYLMCLDGRTRVFKRSENGREMLIYKVGAGGTCVLTTQCLLSGENFPAESVAEAHTELAAIPAHTFQQLIASSPQFRSFVFKDYGRLLSGMFSLVEEVAFATLEQKLARRMIADADDHGIVMKTHQRLASDVGSVREVVSRHLGEWERAGFVRNLRGQIEIVDPAALASMRSA